MYPLDVVVICTNVQTKHKYLCKCATGSFVRIKFNYSEMESMSASSVASSSCEMILGQGAAGTVKVYNSSRLGPVARKMIVIKGCYQREKYFLQMCRFRNSEPLYKFIIDCLGCMHKSDTLFIIDFELAATDLHRAAINVNDVPTGCTQWFPDSDSFDRVITDTLSGLMFLHEHVNIYHNDIKPANLLIVRPNDGPQIIKIGDMGLCTEMDKRGRSFGTFGYSAPEIYDSKRFKGDPVDASYAILGKSDYHSYSLRKVSVRIRYRAIFKLRLRNSATLHLAKYAIR
jgi:hypothetical protein